MDSPRFKYPCRNGASCRNANCHFSHPADREDVYRLNKSCKYGFNCRRASCKFLHPPCKEGKEYIPRSSEKCKWGSNCPNKGGSCKLEGHDRDPPLCRYGTSCRNKDNDKNRCLWSHIKVSKPCRNGAGCTKGEHCLYTHD